MIIFVIATNEFAHLTRKAEEVLDTIRSDGTIEPANNTRLLTALEEVAQLFLGDLYGQIIQFADDE
ncbi:hypothetical protein E4U23_001235 [Claviceps purpurea]|nr:hypothetical protein E4U27_005342 [Claviceps purpurea]KAG6250733.1 hypothetical protein E4U23_001235 [Claviceps purpurea]